VANQGLRTFTLGFSEFRGTENDEVPMAEQVARLYGAMHETRWVVREDFAREISKIIDSMDQPSIDGVNTYFVAKCAQETGLKVALSGLGGDELFCGYPGFHQIPQLVRLSRPFNCVPGLGSMLRILTAPILKRITSPKYAGLLEYGRSWGGAYLLRRSLFMPWELTQFLDPDLVQEGWDKLQTLPSLEASIKDIVPDRLKVTALEVTWYMRNQLLRDTDWASMAHSLEVRVPLVDVPLLRAVAALVHAGFAVGKSEMCSAPEKPLPKEVLQRSKTGFLVPVREWVTELSPKSLAHRGLRGWSLNISKSFEMNHYKMSTLVS
jgi:asparagine synthase (glutamine-hydrolysing)